jgi:tetratricopeptide (TPR) repeat protein
MPLRLTLLFALAQLAVLGATLAFTACTPGTKAAGTGQASRYPEATHPAVEVLPRLVVTEQGAHDAGELLARAKSLASAGKPAEAARTYLRFYETFPEHQGASSALFRAAELADEAGEFPASLAAYERYYQAFPEGASATVALVRIARLALYLGFWERAGSAAEGLLGQLESLTPMAQIVVWSAKALALTESGDADRAATFVERGRSVLEAQRLDEAGRIPMDAAALYFALGEIRRLRAERITFNPVPANFLSMLEQRCQLLLDAQSAYSNSMRAHDARWSTRAGLRVGELYYALHQELMRVPTPATADTAQKRALFAGAMRLRYSVLLRKADGMLAATLAMAERTGESSEAHTRTREVHLRLKQELAAEEASLAQLGHTREELEAALQALAARGAP